jgi:hypothetical protein
MQQMKSRSNQRTTGIHKCAGNFEDFSLLNLLDEVNYRFDLRAATRELITGNSDNGTKEGK